MSLSNAQYLPLMSLFEAHWSAVNAQLAPQSLVIQLPLQKTTMTRAQFVTLRQTVETKQNDVLSRLQDEQIQRGQIGLQKTAVLKQFHLFTGKMDAFYVTTEFYEARPNSPSLRDGQRAFTRPLTNAMTLWAKMNAAAAPPGVTLPLVLADGTVQSAFASALSTLQFAFAALDTKEIDTGVARGARNIQQAIAYEAMKSYRQAVESNAAMFPQLIETLPRLTPLPGHTPDPVNVSGIFQAPDKSKVVFSESDDPALARYELRGVIGEDYDADDAVLVATRLPNEPREFITDFGLGQPGAVVALKVFVILTTGNEAGSAAMIVERPLAQAM